MESTIMVQQAVHGQLLIPISPATLIAMDSVSTVLMAAELTPHLLLPPEAHFRDTIMGVCASLEAMDSAALYRLSQLARVGRPAKMWEIIDQMIEIDNERNEYSRTGRWEPSSN